MTRVQDVMTRNVITVQDTTPFKRIVKLLDEHGVSALPVLNSGGSPIGLVSEADLLAKLEFPAGWRAASLLDRARHAEELGKAEGTVARDLMTPWPGMIPASATLAVAAGRLLHGRIRRLMVQDDHNHLVGIVSRSDLLKVFLRSDEEIRREIVDEVLGRRLGMDPLRFSVEVHDGIVTVDGHVDRRSEAALIEDELRTVDGVVELRPRLSWATDDSAGASRAWYGHA